MKKIFLVVILISLIQYSKAQRTVDISVSPLPTATFSGNTTIMEGDHATLTVNLVGSPVWSFVLNDGEEDKVFTSNQATTKIDVMPTKTTTYKITSVTDALCLGTDFGNYVIIMVESAKITLTNTFSPNGDGINDFLVFPGLDKFPNNEIIIFNRWGNEVFRQKQYKNDWDGKRSNGSNERLATGTYYFILYPGNGEPSSQGYIYLTY